MSVRQRIAALLAIAILEGAYLSMLGLERLANDVPSYITHAFFLSVVYLVCCWLITRRAAEALSERTTLRFIWAAAILFRLTVLPLYPSLSEDVVRYRWQGAMQAAGGDPYLDAPQDARWESLRDETWPRVARKDLTSVYGPVYEQIHVYYFRLIHSFGADARTEVWLFKIPFALADLAVGWLLMLLLSAAARPKAWALIYLWSPLAVVEFWGEGHNDSVTLLFVVAALTLYLRGRLSWALAALTVATLGKIWPLVLFPYLLVSRHNRKWRFHWRPLLICIPIGLVLCAPYWQSLSNIEELLNGFVGGWRNNDSLFGYVYDYAGQDFDAATALTKKLIVIALGLVWILQLRPTQATLAATTVLLLFSANCFPWYLTWLLPLLAVHPSAPLLLWTSIVPLAHHVVTQYDTNLVWEYDRVVLDLEYIPVLTWLMISTTLWMWKRWITRAPTKRFDESGGEN